MRPVGRKVEVRLPEALASALEGYAGALGVPQAEAHRQVLEAGFRLIEAKADPDAMAARAGLVARADDWAAAAATIRADSGGDLRAVWALLGRGQVLMRALAEVVGKATTSD